MDTSFFRFVTMPAFDRQTDGRTDRNGFAVPCVALRAVAWQKVEIFIHHGGECSRWIRVYRAYVSASSVGGRSRRQPYYSH